VAKRKKPPFDYSLVPGSVLLHRDMARKMMRRKKKPVEVRKVGSKWELRVLGARIGKSDTKADACAAAAMVGQYKLDLGTFVNTYTEGCERK